MNRRNKSFSRRSLFWRQRTEKDTDMAYFLSETTYSESTQTYLSSLNCQEETGLMEILVEPLCHIKKHAEVAAGSLHIQSKYWVHSVSPQKMCALKQKHLALIICSTTAVIPLFHLLHIMMRQVKDTNMFSNTSLKMKQTIISKTIVHPAPVS